MPIPLLKSFAKKTDKPLSEVEKLWSKAKEIAKSEGQEGNYAYIVGILKKELGIRESLDKNPLVNPEQEKEKSMLKQILDKEEQKESLRINTVTDFIEAVADALTYKDIRQLEKIERVSSGWMQTSEERKAQQKLINAAEEIIIEVEDLHSMI